MNINGKNYTLVYDFNSICELEETLDLNAIELINSPEKVGFRTIRALMYAGLKNKHDLTLEDVGGLISEYIKNNGSLNKLYDIILKAMRASEIIQEERKDPGPTEKKSIRTTQS